MSTADIDMSDDPRLRVIFLEARLSELEAQLAEQKRLTFDVSERLAAECIARQTIEAVLASESGDAKAVKRVRALQAKYEAAAQSAVLSDFRRWKYHALELGKALSGK